MTGLQLLMSVPGVHLASSPIHQFLRESVSQQLVNLSPQEEVGSSLFSLGPNSRAICCKQADSWVEKEEPAPSN